MSQNRPPKSSLTSASFTCVVLATRWDIPPGTVGFTPAAGKPSKDFITCLKECVNIIHSSKVTTAFIGDFHRTKSQEPLPKAMCTTTRTPSPLISYQSALYCHGPSSFSGVSQFLMSLGGRKGEAPSTQVPTTTSSSISTATAAPEGAELEIEIRNMNLLVVDRDDTSSATICSLISSVADYVLFVDMGPQTLSEHPSNSLPHLSAMRSVFLPAAVASRATILGCSSEYNQTDGGNDNNNYSAPFGGHLAEVIGQYAYPSSLPHWVPSNPPVPKTHIINNFFDVLFPELLFHAAPSSLVATTAISNMLLSLPSSMPSLTTPGKQHQHLLHPPHQLLSTTTPSSPPTNTTTTIPTSDVLSFIASGNDSYIKKSRVSATSAALDTLSPFDYSSLPCEERLGAVVVADPLVPPLLPVLKDRYHLRCSLPFRCVLMTYFSQRRVALIYVIQGVLKRGDSMMSANLHYMGVVAPKSAEGKGGPKNWEKLRQDYEVTTLMKFPISAVDDAGDSSIVNMVAAPGQFVTVQLRCDEEHLATYGGPPSMKNQAAAAQSTSANITGNKKKKRERHVRARQSASGCFVEMLPPYSLCGVFPTDTTTAPSTPLPPPHPIADASISQIMDIPQISTPTSIDALFPRPFAVAEWTPSVLHCGGLSANTHHHHRSLPHRVFEWAVDEHGMYTRGKEGISRGVLVGGCGKQALCDMLQHHPKPTQFGAAIPKQSSDFQHILVNIAAVHNNHGYELCLDTHVHLLDRPPPRNPHHQPTRVSPPERRGIILFNTEGGDAGATKEIAVVVRLRVVFRKLSLIMAAMDIASITIGPASYKHKFEEDEESFSSSSSRHSPAGVVDTPTKPKPRLLPCVHIQDLIEGIHLLRGTNHANNIHNGGDVSPQPLTSDEVAIVHVAAGHELIYEMPVRLMQDLGILNNNRLLPYLPRRRSSSSSPSTIIDDKPPQATSTSSMAEGGMAREVRGPTCITTTPTTVGPPQVMLGVWNLLATALHHLANNNTNWEVSGCRLEYHHSDRDTLLKEGLMLAASWHSTVVRTLKPSTALYMSGRTDLYHRVFDVADTTLDRAAKGPSLFLEYSSITKRFWNLKLGNGLLHAIVRRVLMPELTREWGKGTINEVIDWIHVIQRSALTTLSYIPTHDHLKKIEINMNFENDIKALLHTPGCAPVALLTLIQVVDAYVSEGVSGKDHTRRLQGMGMTLPGVWNSINHLTTGGYLTRFKDVGIPESSVHILYNWFSAAGGVRVFGVPFASCEFKFRSAALKSLKIPENPSTMSDESSPVFGVLSKYRIRPSSITLTVAMSIRGVSEPNRHPHRTDSRLTLSSLVAMYLLTHASQAINAERVRRKEKEEEEGGSSDRPAPPSITILPIDVIAIIVSYLP